MDRRKFLALGGVLFLAGCSHVIERKIIFDGNYETFKNFLEKYQKEKNNFLRSNIKGIVSASRRIQSKINFTGKEDIVEGEALIVYPYLISVAHNTGAYYGGKSETTLRDGTKLEKIVVDGVRDISVFKLPKDYPEPDYSVKLGDSNEMEILNEVYLVGNPGNSGRNIRNGVISHKSEDRFYQPNILTNGFAVSINGYVGDSGTPVINENAEVLGLLSSMILGVGSSNIKPINWFKEYMKLSD